MFSSVLIANRGEIAVRIAATVRARGLRSVAVHSDADAGAPHTRAADLAVRVPDYLDGVAIVDAALATGAQAIHPGYGFLAENADFARRVEGAGLTWVGPPPDAIEAMGDKVRAKATVAKAGVPLVPGSSDQGEHAERGLDDAGVAAAARDAGFPVLLKPSAGGGGKGMHLVERAEDLEPAIAAARREARSSFGDDTLLVERYVTDPRHVEIQVLADVHGGVVHLAERECSLQRRHQKVVEEAPSTVLDDRQRRTMGDAAVQAARACGYVGAGTVEFVTNADASEFFFLEMNTRLQVEHPVTEEVVRVRRARLDLVAEQLRIAAGEPLGYDQSDVALDGHAVEVRVYAETLSIVDGAPVFLPTGGRVLGLEWPHGVRVDAGVEAGTEVGSAYDPMLAKIIARGRDRATALERLDAALAATAVLGVGTNVAWLRTLIADPDVRAGRLDTGLIGRLPPGDDAVPEDVLAVAAVRSCPVAASDDPFDAVGGWRLAGPPAAVRRRLVPLAGGEPVEVTVTGSPAHATVAVGDEPARTVVTVGGDLVRIDGVTRRYPVATDPADPDVVWVGRDGGAWGLRVQGRLAAARADADPAGDGRLTAPMPGTVSAVEVAVGDRVAAGARLVVVEAMKMEHVLRAPLDGVVTDLAARVGHAIDLNAPLITVTPEQEA